MAVAMIYPEPKASRGHKSEAAKVLESQSFSGALVSHARMVLKRAPELAKQVLAGAQALQDAYEKAKQRPPCFSYAGYRDLAELAQGQRHEQARGSMGEKVLTNGFSKKLENHLAAVAL
jgi:hypothetical protein